RLEPPSSRGSLFLGIFLSAEVPTHDHREISWQPDVKQSSSLCGAVVTLNLCHAFTHLSPLNHRSIAANGRRTLKVPAFAKSWRQGCPTSKRMRDLTKRRYRGSMILQIASVLQAPVTAVVIRAFYLPNLLRMP